MKSYRALASVVYLTLLCTFLACAPDVPNGKPSVKPKPEEEVLQFQLEAREGFQPKKGGEALSHRLVLKGTPAADIEVYAFSDQPEKLRLQVIGGLIAKGESKAELEVLAFCLDDGSLGTERVSGILVFKSEDLRANSQDLKFSVLCHPGDPALVEPVALLVDAPELEVREGEALELGFSLDRAPIAALTLNLKLDKPDLGEVVPTSLSFGPEQWREKQRLRLQTHYDPAVTGDRAFELEVSVQSSEPSYAKIKPEPIRLRSLDIDQQLEKRKITFSTQSMQIKENESKPLFIELSHAPSAELSLRFVASAPELAELSPETLTFTPSTWSERKRIDVKALQDGLVSGDHPFEISTQISTSDERYAQLALPKIQVRSLDVDIPAQLIYGRKSAQVYEGQSAELSFKLNQAPKAPVTLHLKGVSSEVGSLSSSSLSFHQDNWAQEQVVKLQTKLDGKAEDREIEIVLSMEGADARFAGLTLDSIKVKIKDSEGPGDQIRLRAMAANITSGNYQSYDRGEGRRIFKAMKPDLVLIQEFQVREGSIADFVREVFGEDYHFYQGDGQIPNGVISRYPIRSSGAWRDSTTASNRDWDWAVIDLPGEKDLLAVSVHLLISGHIQEMPQLLAKIQAKQAEGDYHVLLGGDFNTKSRKSVASLSSFFVTTGPYPVDQNGEGNTNASRKEPYDWVLCDKKLCQYEVPVVIGTRSYPHGHVFDSRVYAKLGELGDVPPVLAGDSGSSNMQHMAVIRDFLLPRH